MFFSPSLFFPPSKPSFFTLKNHFLPTLWNLFFSPFENLFFSPCTLPFSPCSMFLSPFTLFFSPFTLSFSPSTLSFQPSAGEAGNPWNLRRERCHLRLVSRRVCAAAKPVVVTSKTSWDQPFRTLRKLRRDYPERREPAETAPGREAAQHPSMHPSTNGVPTNRPTNEETTRPSKETKQATNEPSNQTT